MTTPAVTESTECRLLTRKERLLVAIWEGWKSGHMPTYRELCKQAGILSTGDIRYKLDRLEEKGIIVRDRGLSDRGFIVTRSLRPGPRFAGIDRATGRPLIVIGDELPEKETREPKYERRSVLFDMAASARRMASVP